MSKVPLPPPRGFRIRQLHKASGGFRSVYPYTRPIKLRSQSDLMNGGLIHDFQEEKYWRVKAKTMHAAFLRNVRSKLKITDRAYNNLSDGWWWKYDDPEQRALFQRVEDEYFREVRFKSPLSLVKEHLWYGAGPYFMKLDIVDAFGSVSYRDYTEFTNDDWFHRRRDDPREIPLAGRIYHGWPFFHPKDGGLIQGAPTSPYLFERYCLISGFDDFLRTYAWSNKFTITRYVDDIIISSSRPFGSKTFGTLRRIFEAEWGFRLHPGKCATVNTNQTPLEFLGVRFFKGAASPNQKFWRGAQKHGMTIGRKRWYDQVIALNEGVPQTAKKKQRKRSKKQRRAA